MDRESMRICATHLLEEGHDIQTVQELLSIATSAPR